MFTHWHLITLGLVPVGKSTPICGQMPALSDCYFTIFYMNVLAHATTSGFNRALEGKSNLQAKKNTSKNFIKSDTIMSYQTSIRAWSAHKGAFNFFRKCMRVNQGSLDMFRPKLAPSLPTACSFLLWSTILFHVRLLSPNFSSTPNWSRVHVSTLCTMHCFGCRYLEVHRSYYPTSIRFQNWLHLPILYPWVHGSPFHLNFVP